ncbi:MAG: hypothetical protein KY392_01020, partial [Chloroflexi bacterium]|nr:hypothetical protein [Chloroflexota bacterium]
THPIGQGYSVNTVQMASIFATIANDGVRITPHILKSTTDRSGKVVPAPAPQRAQVVEPHIAAQLRGMLEGVTNEGGTAETAAIPGYRVAGKTGTAQIAGPVERKDADGETVTRWEYIDGWVDSSYIGFLPNSERKLVTLILLHRPSVWGRYQMAERPETVYSRLMAQVLQYLAIPPDRPLEPVAQP